jgi:hypothetical protein
MDAKFLSQLLHEEESATLDFKRDQYPFDAADDVAKSEVLKDILAMANAWRRDEAYILVGVDDVKGGKSTPVGVATHLDDAKLQQFVNSKTNRPIAFAYEAVAIEGAQVGVVRIDNQERPFFLNKKFGRLEAGVVYIRRGSSTDTADPAEVYRMGEAAARDEDLSVDENLKVTLQAGGAATAAPPFNTGEPLHLAIHLTVMNLGTAPVFIVSAKLQDARGRHVLSFSEVCNEKDALPGGARRQETLHILHHRPFPRTPRHPRTPEELREHNVFLFKLLRFICRPGSCFRIETGRGTVLTYPATEVCDGNFLHWPYIATPEDILKELGAKSLQDFDDETRAAFEKAGAPLASTQHAALTVEVKEFYYQDVTGQGIITGHPRRYLAELAFTNHSERPIYIKGVSATLGTDTYERQEGTEVCRIEPEEYKELQECFPVEGAPAFESGTFEIEVLPAVGNPVRVTGTFPLTSS